MLSSAFPVDSLTRSLKSDPDCFAFSNFYTLEKDNLNERNSNNINRRAITSSILSLAFLDDSLTLSLKSDPDCFAFSYLCMLEKDNLNEKKANYINRRAVTSSILSLTFLDDSLTLSLKSYPDCFAFSNFCTLKKGFAVKRIKEINCIIIEMYLFNLVFSISCHPGCIFCRFLNRHFTNWISNNKIFTHK